MKRILLSSGLIVFTLGALALGSTGAFFSDTETSVGNTFAAGAIDLLVDNESYYNGVLNPETTWVDAVNLTVEKFFNFNDVKPGDYGEDTISLHVDTNDAYLCADISLTSNDDNGINEPESLVDQTDGPGNGELADAVNFIWWADDGDNVLESDEIALPGGPLGVLAVGATTTITLADSETNIWEEDGGPAPGDVTLYIGKAWCFGNIGTDPRDPGEYPNGPAGDNDSNGTPGEPEDGGITCDGTLLGNETQTDSLTANISFSAVQARNNPNFTCTPGETCEIATGTNLLSNGGFETPDVATPQQWDIFDSPVNGWVVEWRSDIPGSFGDQTRPAIAHLEYHEGVLGSASEGDQYAELDSDWGGPSDSGTGEPASVTIYQDIPTTIGSTYEIRYRFAPRPDTAAAENNVEVMWGGSIVDTTGPTVGAAGPIVWSERSVMVVATTTTTRIQFTDRGTANSLGSFIDDVRLHPQICTEIN